MSRSLLFGWRVVAVAFLVAVFAWGIGFYGPSIYMQVLHVARGWSVSVISADVSRVVALTTAINQALFALAPATFGVLEDLTRSYSTSLVLGMAMQVASSAVVLAGRGGRASAERPTRAAGASRSRT